MISESVSLSESDSISERTIESSVSSSESESDSERTNRGHSSSESSSESESDSERTNGGHSSSESLFGSRESADVLDVGGVGDLSLDSGVLGGLLLSGVAGDACEFCGRPSRSDARRFPQISDSESTRDSSLSDSVVDSSSEGGRIGRARAAGKEPDEKTGRVVSLVCCVLGV